MTPLSRFEPTLDAGRFGRATVGVTAVCVLSKAQRAPSYDAKWIQEPSIQAASA
jgi:hypothetical protein